MSIAASSDKLPLAHTPVRVVEDAPQKPSRHESLVEDSVIRKIRTTADDDKNYQTRYYNLDAIIAVGYQFNSYQATKFRIGTYLKKMEAA